MNSAPATSFDLISSSPDQTAAWAAAISEIAKQGLNICLWGDVGAGKSTFARAMFQSLQSRFGTPEDVPSPTFTLVQTYEAGPLEIWHADLYRLSSPDEVFELGLNAAFDTALCLIEWPDRLGDLIPSDAVHIEFSMSDAPQVRHCKLTCTDAGRLSEFEDALRAVPHD